MSVDNVSSDRIDEGGETLDSVHRRPQLSVLRTLSISEDVSEILEFLFLGAKAVSEDYECLNGLGISCVVNCTTDCRNMFEEQGLQYFLVNVKDDINAEIFPFLGPAADFIENARQSNRKALVHCNMGMSRSSSIVLAYLMQHQRMCLAKALRLTKERRAMVSPNSGFMKQLLDFERSLFGTCSIDLELYKKERFGDVESFTLQ